MRGMQLAKSKLVFLFGRSITKPVLWLPWVSSNICARLLPKGGPRAQTAVDDPRGDSTGQLKIIVMKDPDSITFTSSRSDVVIISLV